MKHWWTIMKAYGRTWVECEICHEHYQPGLYSTCSGKEQK